MALSKSKQTKLLKYVEDLLYARRAGNVPREQVCYDKLASYCQTIGVDLTQAIEHGTDYLRNNKIAVNMNGVVPPRRKK